MEQIDLRTVEFTPELLRTVPAATAELYETIPVRCAPGSVVLAMAPMRVLQAMSDELDSLRLELRCVLRREIELAIADGDQIRAFIERLYGRAK